MASEDPEFDRKFRSHYAVGGGGGGGSDSPRQAGYDNYNAYGYGGS